MAIKSIKARQIFDSRGNPTVEVDLTTDKGKHDKAVISLVMMELTDKSICVAL